MVDGDQDAENITFSSLGNYVASLDKGKNYNGISTITEANALNLDIGALSEAYDYLRNPEEIDVDFFLLVGVGYANGFSLPSQLLAIGHKSHFGAFGLHMTAPSSIIA